MAKHVWVKGETITADKLNAIEETLSEVDSMAKKFTPIETSATLASGVFSQGNITVIQYGRVINIVGKSLVFASSISAGAPTLATSSAIKAPVGGQRYVVAGNHTTKGTVRLGVYQGTIVLLYSSVSAGNEIYFDVTYIASND